MEYHYIKMKVNQWLNLLLTVLLVLCATTIVVLLASGYRFDPKTASIQGTGIIAVNSNPDGALVYVNDVAQNASNTTITNLKPGEYKVRLEKEGYSQWNKTLIVKKELVTKVDALLIPLYPSLQPLTFTGADQPTLSPDGSKIIYHVFEGTSAGLWLLDLNERPFNLSQKPLQLLADTQANVYSKSEITWAPTNDSIMLTLNDTVTGTTNYELFDIRTSNMQTIIDIATLRATWENIVNERNSQRLDTINPDQIDTIKTFNNPSWSPDGKTILYSVENENQREYYVYPVNYNQGTDTKSPTPTGSFDNTKPILTLAKDQNVSVQWYPDSQHLIITTDTTNGTATIELIETDQANRTQIFAGAIKDLAVIPNLNGSKLVILTQFNLGNNNYNLYSINLR